MTVPLLSSKDALGGRVYVLDERVVNRDVLPGKGVWPSVTGVIGMLDKSDAMAWSAAGIVAEHAVATVDEWGEHVKAGLPDDYVARPLKGRFKSVWGDAADYGDRVHTFIERTWVGGEDRAAVQADLGLSDVQVAAFSDSVDEVFEMVDSVTMVEGTAYCVAEGWAGSYDMVAVLKNGHRVILDWKAGKRAYSSVALQLQAYAMCEWHAVWLGGTGDDARFRLERLPSVEYGVAVHLPPSGGGFLYVVDWSDLKANVLRALRWCWEYDRLENGYWRSAVRGERGYQVWSGSKNRWYTSVRELGR